MDRPMGIATNLFGGLTVRDIPTLTRMCDDAGYDSMWFAEVAGPDAVTCMSVVLQNSDRMRVGPSVMPIYVRTATLTAITFASLNALGPGRTICGLGVSSPAIVEDWNGLRLRKPVTAMREYVGLLRTIWSERKVMRDGEIFRAKNFRPGIRPDDPAQIPIFIGALNPPMLRLAGAIADGVILNWLPASLVPRQIAEVHAGAREAGRDPSEVTIACNIRVAVTDQVDVAHQAMQREIVGYVIVPFYRKMFEAAGYADECAAVMRGWDAGDRKQAVAEISDRMREGLVGLGDDAAGRAFVQQYVDAGVQYPVLMPMNYGGDGMTMTRTTMAAFA